jgi:phosphoribosylformylglycinamidine synthase
VKTVKEGGVAVALAKMSFGNRLGAEINADETVLLAKNIGSLIIESKEELSSASLQLIGEVKDSGVLKSTI